jgi:ferric-dicitrate binding protein FerR (iron transport regulator)
MPYKDAARKRQWEKEHREKRNAIRRIQRLTARSGQPNIPRPAPDPASKEQPTNGWKVLLGLAVGIGVVLLGAMAGIDVPPGPSPGLGNPGN